MARSCSPSCCRCLSLQSLTVFAAFVAVFVMVINPALNHLSDRLDPKFDETEPVVVEEVKQQKPFDPSQTDVMGYSTMAFVKEGMEAELRMGLMFLMTQSCPRWMVRLAEWYEPTTISEGKYEQKDIDILDARKNTATFAERGFTLVDMKDSPSIQGVQNWRSQEQITAFQKELEPKLFELFPHASRFEYTYSVVRGGSMFGDQPAAIDGPHLDYSQNDDARRDFHKRYPPSSFVKEQHMLLGNDDTETEEMKVLLGIWKPVMMDTPVCDYPLAVMDARTFVKEQEVMFPIHINFGVFTFHNLNGNIHHHQDQQWYYYPLQNESEVLVFTQYSKDKHFANPHGSFQNPNCPEDSDHRVSVEMRVAVFFPK